MSKVDIVCITSENCIVFRYCFFDCTEVGGGGGGGGGGVIYIPDLNRGYRQNNTCTFRSVLIMSRH